MRSDNQPGHQEILLQASAPEAASGILSAEALSFIASLQSKFGARIGSLLDARRRRQERIDQGEVLCFLRETKEIRDAGWRIAPLPQDLLNRQVEITGPVDRKMIVNALNSGANVFMADFEDSSSPTWENMVVGQKHLRDAVFGEIDFYDEGKKKHYAVCQDPATLMVRPRGLHLLEKHLVLDSKPLRASLVDFGLYFFHNAKKLLEKNTGPYFYLPKLESHTEAKLWNDVFLHAQNLLGVPARTIKATVLIETLPAAFEMDEIIYELRDHMAGLNCGRWDYIFSFIKNHRSKKDAVLPDRSQVGMEQPFMRAYTQLVIKTCHRRGAFAMGGMAAQIPIKNDVAKNEEALAKVHGDKLREARDGHDGTWVAHPGLVPIAKEIFSKQLGTRKNQLHVLREDFQARAEDLLSVPTGTRTLMGLEHNARIGLRYIEAWLRGNGCVPLYNLMEDAATAEISRSQIWQWLHHEVFLDDSIQVTPALIASTIDKEMALVQSEMSEESWSAHRFEEAKELFWNLCTSTDCIEFLTTQAYERIVSLDGC